RTEKGLPADAGGSADVMPAQSSLTFAALDGLAFAAERGRLHRATTLALSVRNLAPLFELLQLAASGLLPLPEHVPWLSLDGEAKFYTALASGRVRQRICPTTRCSGFIR